MITKLLENVYGFTETNDHVKAKYKAYENGRWCLISSKKFNALKTKYYYSFENIILTNGEIVYV